MAHELLVQDNGEAAMFFVKDVPWHELGTRLERPPTAQEAIVKAGLDWHVEKVPLFYHLSLRNTGILDKHFALIPTGGWQNREQPVFGVVGPGYHPLQNTEAFAFFDPLIESGFATYETAGALGKGERVWVMAKLKGDIEIAKDDAVQRYLLLSNTHDGNSAVQIKFTPVRVVCNNTLTLALHTGPQALWVRHDEKLIREMRGKSELFRERIASHYEQVSRQFKSLAARHIHSDSLDKYVEKLFPIPYPPPKEAENEVLRRYEREAERLKLDRKCCISLYSEGPHNNLESIQGTAWAAYNAVTEYVDHRSYNNPRYLPGTRLNSIWFGDGFRLKARAFNVALEMWGEASRN